MMYRFRLSTWVLSGNVVQPSVDEAEWGESSVQPVIINKRDDARYFWGGCRGAPEIQSLT